MPRTLELTLPPARTGKVVEEIRRTEGLIGYRVHPGGSAVPSGDVVTVLLTNRSLHPLLRSLEERGLLRGSEWTAVLSEPTGLIAPARRDDVQRDTTDIPWEEMDFTLLRESNMTTNALLVMVVSGVLAAVGISGGVPHLVIAAMVIAPGFEPITRIALDLVSGSGRWQRGVQDTLLAYGALLLGAVVAALVLLLVGGAPLLALDQGLHVTTGSMVGLWLQMAPASFVVAVGAGAAGAALVASNRSVLTAGVMIALALVPPPAIAGLALVAGEPALMGRALVRWTVEVGIVAATALAVFAWKRRTIQQRRALH